MKTDDLQFFLLEHKMSKSHVLSDTALINKLYNAVTHLRLVEERGIPEEMSRSEVMQLALKISVDAFILAENIKV